MSEKEDEEGALSDAINAVANLAKAVPIYDDALQPVMKEAGQALSTVGKAVNVALSPIRGFVWGAERVEEWLVTNVAAKLKETPVEDIQTPDLAIAGPTIEALKFNGHKRELSEMLAGLLSGAMKKDTMESAHPAFVEIIKSMTSLDARLFAEISKRNAVPTMNIERRITNSEGTLRVVQNLNPRFTEIAKELGVHHSNLIKLVQSSVENLSRLGLIETSPYGHLSARIHEEAYNAMKEGEIFNEFKKLSDGQDFEFEFRKSYIKTTQLGVDLGNIAL